MFVRIPIISSIYWFFLGFKRLVTGRKHTCEIDVTNQCNQKCRHCYFYGSGEKYQDKKFSIKIWQDRFKQLYNKGIRKILLVGGEPTLRMDVLELADKIFPVIHVITNGTLKIPRSFSHTLFVSIDGAEETNDNIRGKGTFSKVLNNYQNDSRVILNMTLFADNFHELEDVVKIAKKNRFSGVTCNIYCNSHADDEKYDDFVPSKTHGEIIKELKRVKKLYPSSLLFTNSMIRWFAEPDHRQNCYWREKVDHYDVAFQTRKCFMKDPDCARCGCYAGAFSNIANKPWEILAYSTKFMSNKTLRFFQKKIVLFFLLIPTLLYSQQVRLTLEDLQAGAEAGNVKSQVALGNCYFFGTHGVKDYDLAHKWYQKAVDNGSKAAFFNLALCYENGFGVEKDSLKAFHLYKKAAEEGIPEAEFNVAMCYKAGIYFENKALLAPNLTIAKMKLKKLVDNGFIPAYRALAQIYLEQKDEDKYREAFEMLMKASFHKDAQAMNLMADCYNFGWGCQQNKMERINWLERAASAGSMEACAKLAFCYENGDGVPADPKRALRYYANAAAAGLPMAQVKMAEAYAYGNHVSQDIILARKWYERAASSGNAKAIFSLGLLAFQGIGEKKDLEKAAKFFLRAAKLNEPHAQFNIATFFLNGRGVPKDQEAAFFWFKRAAEQGAGKAQRELAFCYFNGIGTEKDYEKGMKWLRKAVANDDAQAKKFLNDISL